MEKFKNAIMVEAITSTLMTGRPLSRQWKFPDFFLDKKFEPKLSNIFGEEGYEIYSKMSEDEKKEAREIFETHGESVAKMYKAELYEDWDDSKHFKFDLQYLFNNHRKVYEKVATNITNRAYSIHPKEVVALILERFLISPTDLTVVIVTSVSKK